jgi:hypothetical protein
VVVVNNIEAAAQGRPAVPPQSTKHVTERFSAEAGLVLGMVGKNTIHAPECGATDALTLFQSCQLLAAQWELI